jgi:AcrR family transcriptional regulator
MDAPERMPRPAPDLRWVRAPQQARSQETLDRILDAAEALVTEKGFEEATVAEVARRAESSVGAFYARFCDKTGLLYALHDRYFEQAMATADLALDPARWAGTKIPVILRAVVRFLVEVYRERQGLIPRLRGAQPGRRRVPRATGSTLALRRHGCRRCCSRARRDHASERGAQRPSVSR